MASNPSVSFPAWMLTAIDERRGNTPRSTWIQQACMGRITDEDAGEWEAPEVDPDGVDFRDERTTAVAADAAE